MRLLEGEAVAVVEYVLAAAERSPMTGTPIGMREWPRPGGLLAQRAQTVEAIETVLGELQEIAAQRTTPTTNGTRKP